MSKRARSSSAKDAREPASKKHKTDAEGQEKFTAYASLEKGSKLEKWEYEPEPLGECQLEVKITHNGLCHTDIHMRDNDWGVSTFPLVAGHEVVGEVVKKGDRAVGFEVGDRVGLGWIRDSCRHCESCLKGEENICYKGYTGLIVGNHGGFADRIRAPADFAYKIPDALDSASAAPLLCAGITVYTPLRTYIRRPGTKVGVMGVGGLGHLALQFAKKMGAEVTALSTTKEKEEECRGFGADHFVCMKEEEAVEAVKNTLDLIVDCAPVSVDWKQALELLRNDGTLVVCGIPADELTVPIIPLVFSQKRVTGSIVGGRRFITEMLEFAAVHGVKPMVETMPLSQVNEAMEKVAANKARYRIVLTSDFE